MKYLRNIEGSERVIKLTTLALTNQITNNENEKKKLRS